MSACGALPMPNGAVIMTPFRSPIWDSNPNVIGSFVGTDVTSTWACPKGHWFPADICDSATRVISGVQTFIQPGRGELFSVNAEYVVTDDGTLWNYWPDLSLVCPWYPTFGQALTSPAECIFRHA